MITGGSVMVQHFLVRLLPAAVRFAELMQSILVRVKKNKDDSGSQGAAAMRQRFVVRPIDEHWLMAVIVVDMISAEHRNGLNKPAG